MSESKKNSIKHTVNAWQQAGKNLNHQKLPKGVILSNEEANYVFVNKPNISKNLQTVNTARKQKKGSLRKKK